MVINPVVCLPFLSAWPQPQSITVLGQYYIVLLDNKGCILYIHNETLGVVDLLLHLVA